MVHSDKGVLCKLSQSQIYKDYERAFSETTGLPLTLRSAEIWKMAHHGKKHESPFCAIMAESSKTCAACLEVQEKISDPNASETSSAICFAGLCDTAVPVRVG